MSRRWSVGGMVTLELVSADIPECLRQINAAAIAITNLRTMDELCARFDIHRTDFSAVQKLVTRRGDRLQILRRRGLYWQFQALRRRKLLVMSVLLLALGVSFLPSRIFFIEVSGNTQVPTRQILEAAAESGVRFGAARRSVRSEKLKNALLEKIPQLKWAGIQTNGCTAVITVRERTTTQLVQNPAPASHIVAARDGVIVSCTATAGTALCSVGQAVQAGQMLISGYTDCGIALRVSRAEGEVLAWTSRALTAQTPAQTLKRVENGKAIEKFSLRIGKKRINFYKGSGICHASCAKMYEAYILTLPGGFTLPVTLIRERIIPATLTDVPVDEERARAQLQQFSSAYLTTQMVGGQITSRREQFDADGETVTLSGVYGCCEQIGRRKQEQIGESYGKTN